MYSMLYSRFHIQVMDIHVEAFYLNPAKLGVQLIDVYRAKIVDMFAPTQLMWEFADKPFTFWHMFDMSAAAQYPNLLGDCSRYSPMQLQSSEYSHVLSWVHSWLRNRLTAEKVDKLCYTPMNQGILNHNFAIPQDVWNKSDTEQIQFE